MQSSGWKHLSKVWARVCPREFVRGKGAYLYDAEGSRLLDFSSGIGVTSLGHCHPRHVKAIKDQADKLLFAQINCVANPFTPSLAEALNEVTPDSIDTFWITNSGAEAVEASVKMVRRATSKTNLIVMQGSFHGRSHQCMAMTRSKAIYRAGFEPLPGAIFTIPFPHAFEHGCSEKESVDFSLDSLEMLLKRETKGDETAAVFIEPVLGEGGYVAAPPSFLHGLRRICDREKILIVADEVQSGFGRTGKFFGFEHAEGFEPDLIVMAKGMGSGVPIAAVGGNSSIVDSLPVGSHGGTYGGGTALSVVGATETIRIIEEEGLVENARVMGEMLQTRLQACAGRYPHLLGEIRGRGLMIGTEFRDIDGNRRSDICKAVQQQCLKRGLLLLTCSAHDNTIRWIPPLIISEEHIDEAVWIFEEALAEVDSNIEDREASATPIESTS